MKAFNLVFKILLALFFVICLVVHVQGLLYHSYPESNVSHVIHLVSYSVCLLTTLRVINYRLLLYLAGLVYPFCYHANCLWMHYNLEHKISPVCLLVVVLMPLGAGWIWSQRKMKI